MHWRPVVWLQTQSRRRLLNGPGKQTTGCVCMKQQTQSEWCNVKDSGFVRVPVIAAPCLLIWLIKDTFLNRKQAVSRLKDAGSKSLGLDHIMVFDLVNVSLWWFMKCTMTNTKISPWFRGQTMILFRNHLWQSRSTQVSPMKSGGGA